MSIFVELDPDIKEKTLVVIEQLKQRILENKILKTEFTEQTFWPKFQPWYVPPDSTPSGHRLILTIDIQSSTQKVSDE